MRDLFDIVRNADYQDLGVLENVPENVSFLSLEPAVNQANANVGLFWNDKIKHLKISNSQPSSYYLDYVMTTSYSKAMQELQYDQVMRLSELCNDPERLSFIEIGCGDGSFLKHASNVFGSVTGVEPSVPFCNLARAAGFCVINEYLTSKNVVTDQVFDAFASRQVFEHLDDPIDCLLGIKNILSPGAVGFIEVPNGYRAITEKRFYEFFPDHVNYFSVNSLVALVNEVGFSVIGCNESFNRDYIEVWMRNDVTDTCLVHDINSARASHIDVLVEWIDRAYECEGVIAFWGVGAKGLSVLSQDPGLISKKVFCAVDSDPNKWGKYIPNTELKIISPEKAASSKVTHVFVLALSYQEEIISYIHNNFPQCKAIATYDECGGVMNKIFR